MILYNLHPYTTVMTIFIEITNITTTIALHVTRSTPCHLWRDQGVLYMWTSLRLCRRRSNWRRESSLYPPPLLGVIWAYLLEISVDFSSKRVSSRSSSSSHHLIILRCELAVHVQHLHSIVMSCCFLNSCSTHMYTHSLSLDLTWCCYSAASWSSWRPRHVWRVVLLLAHLIYNFKS
jgi:hypothetical protein